MGCGCNGNKRKVAFAVTLKDGTKPVGSPYDTAQAAQAEVRKAGGGHVKVVPKP